MTIELMYALLLGASIGAVAGYLGSLMITKRMALVGGAFGHLAMPGVSLALLYGFDVTLGALLVLLVGAVGIWLLNYATKLSFESLTGVIFALSLAISFLVLPQGEIDIALLGDISQVSGMVVLIGCSASFGIYILVRSVYNHLIIGMISEESALVEGIPLKRDNLIYMLCIGLVVALGVRIVGGLMTAALVTIPAASANNISRSLPQYTGLSLMFGALSCIMGIFFHGYSHYPVGPLIILSSGVFFALSLVGKIIRPY